MDPLASPQDLATYLRQDVDTAAAEMFLAGASATIRNYCRWDVTFASGATVTLDTDGGRLIAVPCLNVTAINSVTLDGVALTPDTDYTWSAMGALQRRHHPCTAPEPDHLDWFHHYGWPPGFRRVVVNYDGGFDPLPPELILVCCSIASRSMVPVGITQQEELVGGIRVNFQYRTNAQNARLLGSEQLMLDRYRIPLEP
jgi:hypothetical protein